MDVTAIAALATQLAQAKTAGDKLAASERAAGEAQERLGRLEHLLAEEEKAHVAMAAEIETLKSANEMTLEMHGIDPKSGKEYKMMEISFTRTGNAPTAAAR
jgi:hypothetical protein